LQLFGEAWLGPDLPIAAATIGRFKKYGIHAAGFWTNEISDSRPINPILAYESLTDHEKK
jgi:hypothetical protein